MEALQDIPHVPEIPEGLRLAWFAGKLTPFVGAGASMIAGSPSWAKFAEALLEQLRDAKAIDHEQFDQITHYPVGARVRASIAHSISEHANVPLNYKAILHPGMITTNVMGRRLYSAIGRLAESYVTTNYDGWLDQAILVNAVTGEVDDGRTQPPPRANICRASEISFARLLEPNTVIHLHGSLADPDLSNLVVTTSQYLRHYGGPPDANAVVTFLTHLFRNRSILFVGYGLDELEILEYVFLKMRSGRIGSSPEHFILQGFHSSELSTARFLQRYFAECGVTLLPFRKNERGWDQLVWVMEYLAEQLPVRAILDIEERKEMEGLLDE